jgi:NADH dehydrogenase
MTTKFNIPETERERIVIIGAGFAGLELAKRLAKSRYQVVLLDKNNFHQFQPLFYQVAMAGLEPSSIVFPLRKMFQRNKNVHIRVTEVDKVDVEKQQIYTPIGYLNFDYLVLAIGADTNFFGNERIAEKAIPMKSVSEALYLRNQILSDYEKALITPDYDQRQKYLDIVVVGGGATGVEVCGSLAEMKEHILPKDYPELDCNEIDIHLIQSSDRLLKGMSDTASQGALDYLTKLGVKVQLNTRVKDYDGEHVYMKDGSSIPTHKMIWAAGIRGNTIEGLPTDAIARGNRIKIDEYMTVKGAPRVFAIGDIAVLESEENPYGHPQVAQVAIQMGVRLAKNFKAESVGKLKEKFVYDDKGSMATVGRNKAVVDLPKWKFKGAFAWFIWLFVHLFSLVGFRNKIIVFLNWVVNYFTYDQSLRLIIRPKEKKSVRDNF